ncbi:unnamed protein product [Merluccius merluccius]
MRSTSPAKDTSCLVPCFAVSNTSQHTSITSRAAYTTLGTRDTDVSQDLRVVSLDLRVVYVVVGIAAVAFTGFLLMLVILKFGGNSKFGIKAAARPWDSPGRVHGERRPGRHRASGFDGFSCSII